MINSDAKNTISTFMVVAYLVTLQFMFLASTRSDEAMLNKND